MDDLKFYTKIFKALSNPHRLEIFWAIKRKSDNNEGAPSHLSVEELPDGCCLLGPLTSALGIGTPTVSHHLKELVNAELVETQKFGKYVGVSLNQKTWAKIKKGFFDDKFT